MYPHIEENKQTLKKWYITATCYLMTTCWRVNNSIYIFNIVLKDNSDVSWLISVLIILLQTIAPRHLMLNWVIVFHGIMLHTTHMNMMATGKYLWRPGRCSDQEVSYTYFSNHDDVIKWKHFPRYWPFVRGIHRSPVNSPHKGQWRELWCFLWSASE